MFMTLCGEALRYERICRCIEPSSIRGALETYDEGPTSTLLGIEGTTITGGYTLIQVVKVASDHLEVSAVHQDRSCVVPNGQKRETRWHYDDRPRSHSDG